MQQQQIKTALVWFRNNLRVNDKLFFGLLVFTLKNRCFSIYFNLDFFLMFKPFVLLLIVLVSVMFVLLFNYVVYLYILSNFPKNMGKPAKVHQSQIARPPKE